MNSYIILKNKYIQLLDINLWRNVRARRDGSFDALFDKHFARALAELKLGQRVVIALENPYLPAWVPLQRKELWFDHRK